MCRVKSRLCMIVSGTGLFRATRVVVDGFCACGVIERDKGIRWMPWHQEATKDVARCEKPWGAASRL